MVHAEFAEDAEKFIQPFALSLSKGRLFFTIDTLCFDKLSTNGEGQSLRTLRSLREPIKTTKADAMQQAADFLEEGEALHALFVPLDDAAFDKPTLFKGWTINQILRHLHVWNIAAGLSLKDEAAFAQFMTEMMAGIRGGKLPDFEDAFLDGLSGTALVDTWRTQFQIVARHFAKADPHLRVKWVGPDMSARSSITARLMETWAHGQAIYDALGVKRVDGDRIGNIVRLGVNTYGRTFKNRREEPLGPMPRLHLTAPSGAIWEYGSNEGGSNGLIEGSATEFCQVITQCRNIADTSLTVNGDVAHRWMAVAQCFAGPPQTPPAPGTRHPAQSAGIGVIVA